MKQAESFGIHYPTAMQSRMNPGATSRLYVSYTQSIFLADINNSVYF